jgi:hypothetical protein
MRNSSIGEVDRGGWVMITMMKKPVKKINPNERGQPAIRSRSVQLSDKLSGSCSFMTKNLGSRFH